MLFRIVSCVFLPSRSLTLSREITDPIQLRLRYWNCRGRAQAVRYILEEIAYAHSNVKYREETEYLEKTAESWPARKSDETISGPFHNLPVLYWNDKQTFGQTLTIAQLLARKFNLYGRVTSSIVDEDFLHGYIDGVVSCAYTDIINNIPTCIWSRVDFVNESDPIGRLTKKIPTDFKALNGLLAKSSTTFYYDQPEPTIADYFVFEAFMASRDYSPKLLPDKDNRQALEKLVESIKQRPAIDNYLKKGLLYKRFCASPTELEYLAKLKTNPQHRS